MNSGIYCISSITQPEKKYIGSAKNLQQRKARHFRDLAKNKHHSGKLQNHYNKYGVKDLKFDVLLLVPNDQLLYWEELALKYFVWYFNICPCAGSRAGTSHTNQTKNQIAKSKREHPRPQPEDIIRRFTG